MRKLFCSAVVLIFLVGALVIPSGARSSTFGNEVRSFTVGNLARSSTLGNQVRGASLGNHFLDFVVVNKVGSFSPGRGFCFSCQFSRPPVLADIGLVVFDSRDENGYVKNEILVNSWSNNYPNSVYLEGLGVPSINGKSVLGNSVANHKTHLIYNEINSQKGVVVLLYPR